MAEFESDLIKMRTREGMKVAKAKGRLRGKQPKLKPNRAKHLLELHDSGNYTQAELAELFGVAVHDLPHHRQDAATTCRTGAAIRPPCAAIAEHPNQHSAEILSNRVTRQ